MQGEDRKEPAKSALDAYKDAQEAAENLPSTNPISLGLALNFSVFYYEILDSPDEACRLAKKAFDSAVGDLDKSNESQYKESTLILQLLRDNLTLWTSEMQEEGEDGGITFILSIIDNWAYKIKYYHVPDAIMKWKESLSIPLSAQKQLSTHYYQYHYHQHWENVICYINCGAL